MLRFFLLSAVLVVATALASAQTVTTLNSLVDWGNPQPGTPNPSNGWHYLAFERGQPHVPASYHPMVVSEPSVWSSPVQSGCKIFKSGSNPIRVRTTDEFEAVRAWQATGAGSVAISLAEDLQTPNPGNNDGSFIETWRNGYRVARLFLPPGNTPASAYKHSFRVNDGDWVYFHVNARKTPWDDHPTFQPVITFTSDTTGHSTATISKNTQADFGTSAFDYYWYDASTKVYTSMVYSAGPPAVYHRAGQTHPSIEATRQHPLFDRDCVTKYTVPEDGLLVIHGPAIAKTSDNTPVSALLYHAPGATPILIERVDDITTAGRRFDHRLHVREGDAVYLHIRRPAAGNSGLYTNVNLTFELHPNGLAPVELAPTPSGGYTAGTNEYHFNRYIKLSEDLVIPPSAKLELRHCILQFENENDRDYRATINGDFETRYSLVGGNRLPLTHPDDPGAVRHSNFNVDGSAKWISRDGEVRYSYGLLSGQNAELDFERHLQFVQGDYINLQDGVQARMVDVTGNFVTALPLDYLDPTVTASVFLPLASPSSNPATLGISPLAGYPWSPAWEVDYQNLWVGIQNMRLTGVSNTGPSIDIDGMNAAFAVRLSQVSGVTGEIAPPETPTASTTTFGVFNSNWTVGTMTTIRGWSADFKDQSDVRIRGPIRTSELMAFTGSKVTLLGTPGTTDAICSTTTVRGDNAGTRMIFDNVTLGAHYTTGEIKAENGARITVRDAAVDHRILLRALGDDGQTPPTASKIIFSTTSKPNDVDPTLLLTDGNVHVVYDHWSFDDNTGEWRNWDPAIGFVPAGSWSIGAVSGNNGALRLDYNDPATVSGGSAGMNNRIVSPRDGYPVYENDDVYLYVRMRVSHANPQRFGPASEPLCRVVFGARQNGNWATSGALSRQMDVIADGQFHDYCWNIGTPADTNPALDPIVSYGSAIGFSPGIDYMGLTIGVGSLDTITAGDFVEIDFITVGPNYDAQLRN